MLVLDSDYEFDVKLAARVKVRAKSVGEAREMIESIRGWDPGDSSADARVQVVEYSADDIEPLLLAVNGEEIEL